MHVEDYNEAKENFLQMGFQATELARAVEIIEKMKEENATIFLGFTANLVATGARGIIKEMCQKKFCDAIITTSGSLDHDIIRSEDKYEIRSFNEDDGNLYEEGKNRIGNVIVETKSFESLEKRIQPFLKKIYEKSKITKPTELAREIGKELNENSFLYWCAKNEIPVFCPGITDGAAFGLQAYFFKQEYKDFVIDVTGDMKELGDKVLNAENTGAIIFGGGITKHHIIGANLLRGGLDYSVYVSTGMEYDGSLSGAKPKEAKSWGKIRKDATTAMVNCEGTIAMPLMYEMLREKGLL